MNAAPENWNTSPEAAAQCGMSLAVWAAAAPDRAAVVDGAGEHSFSRLNRRANQFARVLRGYGLRAGSGVCLICSNRAEFMEVHAACMRAGLVLTPVNWHLSAEEMAYIVADSEAEVVIAEHRFCAVALTATEQVSSRVHRIAIGGPIDGFESLEALAGEQPEHDLEDPVLGSPMLYTSGTTGHPKGVRRWPPRPSPQLGALMRKLIQFRPGEDRALVTGPLYHAAPLNLNAVGALNAGVGLVLMDKWDAEETLRLIDHHKIAFTHLVPTMFVRLLRLPAAVRNRYALGSLRAVLHGAAPCPAHIKREMIEWLGPVVFEYYAATEGGATLATSEEWLARPGTVGQAVEGAQVRVLTQDMQAAAPGEEGTAYFRAPPDGQFVYFKAHEKTADSYYEGFFTMRDRGYMDEDGYLFLTGRDAELIISGGVNVYPQEIDAVLLRLPQVEDACTIGIPSEEWGEQIKAIVQLSEGLQPSEALTEEIITYCHQHLASFKCPRSIEFRESLPRLPSGKIQRHKVRAPYWPDP